MNIKVLIRHFKHISRRRSIRKAQKLLRRYVPEGRSLADELIAERRAEEQQSESS